jgi:hypothetical protein
MGEKQQWIQVFVQMKATQIDQATMDSQLLHRLKSHRLVLPRILRHGQHHINIYVTGRSSACISRDITTVAAALSPVWAAFLQSPRGITDSPSPQIMTLGLAVVKRFQCKRKYRAITPRRTYSESASKWTSISLTPSRRPTARISRSGFCASWFLKDYCQCNNMTLLQILPILPS